MTQAAANGEAEPTRREAAANDDDDCIGGNLPSTSSSLPPPPPSSSLSSLPVIDIAPLLSPCTTTSPVSREALRAAEAIAATCLKSRGRKALGFFYAVGHGIPEATLDAAHSSAAALWDAPVEIRSSLDARKSELSRGYLGLGALEHTCTRAKLATLAQERLGEEKKKEKKEGEKEKKEGEKKEKTKPSGGGDLKQSFAFGCEREEGDPRTHSPMHGPNQWPDAKAIEQVPALASFRSSVEEFRRLGLEAARSVARGLSLALTEDENEKEKRDASMFESALSKPAALTVMLRYPPLPEQEEGEEGENSPPTSCGTHTDCGFLTLIDQRGLPGLEVFSNDRRWISVPPLKVDGQSALVVNLGDLAEYWSGGRVASTLHRVEVRKKKKKKSEENGNGDENENEGLQLRDSLIVFSNANFDAPVVPPGGGGKATTAGAYIFEKLGIMWNGGEVEEKEKKEKGEKEKS